MSALRYWLLPHDSNNQRARLLHPTGIALATALFVGLQLWLSYFTRSLPRFLGYAAQIPASEIVRLTNQQRAAKGLPEVYLDPELTAAATAKAADMLSRGYWAHVSPTGIQPWSFITQTGYQYRYAGENLARDFSAADGVVKAWMNSPTHRDNLLNPKYHDIGVAVVDGKLGDRETTLVVQMFGTRLSAVPVINPVAAANFNVRAAEASVPEPVVSTPMVSPFTITKLISLSFVGLFLLVLAADIVSVYRHKIVRWTSRSLAHVIFLGMLLVAASIASRGQIF